MNDREKQKFWLLTDMKEGIFLETIETLEQTEVGQAILENWLNDLLTLNLEINRLESKLYEGYYD